MHDTPTRSHRPLDISALLHDRAASFWLKDALRSAMRRDPVDAAADAAILRDVLDARCAKLLYGGARVPKVYFAGPDVFSPAIEDWRARVIAACRAVGVMPLLPCDNASTNPTEIVSRNLGMIQDADAVVANLNPFRGAEPDSGTVFEAAMGFAIGRSVVGYVSSAETVAERVARLQQLQSAAADQDGYAIENFGRCVNIMLAESFPIVVGDQTDALRFLLPSLNAAVG